MRNSLGSLSELHIWMFYVDHRVVINGRGYDGMTWFDDGLMNVMTLLRRRR